MSVFGLRVFFLNSVNYNCARIHFSIAHFGPFYYCAFWAFLLLRIWDLSIVAHFEPFNCCAFGTFLLLRILDLSIVAHFGPFNCCAFWTFQLLRISDLSIVAHFGLFYCCTFLTVYITIAQARLFLLRIVNDFNYLGAWARLTSAHILFNSASIAH